MSREVIRTTLTLTPELAAALRLLSRCEGRSAARILARALAEYASSHIPNEQPD